jgi:hypothetical protein
VAKQLIPDAIQRRHLLERELDPTKARAIADAYRAGGRLSEAVAFYAKAGASSELEQVAAAAVESGDVFLLKLACMSLGREPSSEQWRAAAEAAERAGRLRYASTARRQIGSDD